MYKRRYSRLILFSVLAVIAIVLGGVFFSQQKEEKRVYNAIKNCEPVTAQLHRLDGVNYDGGGYNLYRFTFTVPGGDKRYTYVTANRYKSSIEQGGGTIMIMYLPAFDGSPELLYETDANGDKKPSTAEVNGLTYYVTADSREASYFNNSQEPTMALPVFVFILAACAVAAAGYHLFFILLYKSVERHGVFTYAVFDEACTSKFGSMRHMAIKFRYKTEDEKWIEAKSPYCFSPFDIEKLKGIDAFGIKYRGKTAVITEDLRKL